MKYLKMRGFILLLCIIAVIVSGCSSIKTPTEISLLEENIEKHLNYFTSKELEGRIIGSEENKEVINYIESYFKEIGLRGFDGENYKIDFNTLQPQLGSPSFQVIDQGGVLVKSYEHLVDYRIPIDGISVGGNFTGNVVHVTEHLELLGTDDAFSNQAVLIDYQNPSIQIISKDPSGIDDRLVSEKADVIIYPESLPVNIRDIQLPIKDKFAYNNEINGALKIGVPKNIYEELIDYTEKGFNIKVETPLNFQQITSSNVVGVIPGKSKQYQRYIIVATSLDGLGKDEKGNIYPTASDNGSSLALLLELAREMKDRDIQLDATILFMTFNGKHTGNIGVERYFVNPLTPRERTQVIFLDELGAEKSKPLKIATLQRQDSSRKRSQSQMNRLASLGEELGIEHTTDWSYGRSEFLAFRRHGIAATVLTRMGTDYIGTAQDTSELIYIEDLVNSGNLIMNYLIKYGNVNLIAEIKILLDSGLWVLILCLVAFFTKKHYRKRDKAAINPLLKRVLDYPIVFLILSIGLLYTILKLQVWYMEMDIQGAMESQVMLTKSIMLHHLLMNSFAMIVMGVLFCIHLVYLAIVGIPIIGYKKDMNNTLFIAILAITGAIGFYIPFKHMYDPLLDVLMPNILAPNFALVLMCILPSFLSFLIFWVYMKERELWKGDIPSKAKILVGYLMVIFVVALFIYGPYVASKEIQELRILGRGVFFK